jgi:hypothetical protein
MRGGSDQILFYGTIFTGDMRPRKYNVIHKITIKFYQVGVCKISTFRTRRNTSERYILRLVRLAIVRPYMRF